MLQLLIVYVVIGASFVVYDCITNKDFREIFSKHRAMIALQIIRWPISIFRRIRNKLTPSARDSSGFKSRDSSYYRRWVVKNEPSMQEKKEVDDEMMFTGLMMFLGQFNPVEKRITTVHRETPEQLGDDSALFEIGCYLLSMVDRWMYGKHPDRREHFVRYAMEKFIKLSGAALSKPIEDVASIFNQRMSRYGEMYRDPKPGAEREMIERLTDFVTYSAEHGTCFPGREAPLSLSLERLETLMQLQIWATTHGNAALDSLEKCISTLPADQRRDMKELVIGSPEWRRSHALCFVAVDDLFKIVVEVFNHTSDWFIQHVDNELWKKIRQHDSTGMIADVTLDVDKHAFAYMVVVAAATIAEGHFWDCKVHKEMEKVFFKTQGMGLGLNAFNEAIGMTGPASKDLPDLKNAMAANAEMAVKMLLRIRKASYRYAKAEGPLTTRPKGNLLEPTVILKQFYNAPALHEAFDQLIEENLKAAKDRLDDLKARFREHAS